MLHLVSLAQVDAALMARIAAGDVVVLLDDAVYHCLASNRLADQLADVVLSSRCYVLAEHLLLRGIATTEILAGITVIDYPALVNLTVENTPIYTWA